MDKAMKPTKEMLKELRTREGNHKLRPKSRPKYVKLTPEEAEEKRYWREADKRAREESKAEKLRLKQLKIYVKRELNILNYMLKTDVLYHHHGVKDSTKKDIQKAIDKVKEINNYREYNPYIWNYQGQGNNYMSISQFGCIFRGNSEFKTIYDVPLDGSYIFYMYDSGQRGLGSFHYISLSKVEQEINVPKVNPGAFPPITC